MKKKILIICPYPQGVAAGQRLKYEQYISNWEEQGFDITVSPFMSMAMWKIVHKKGFIMRKIWWTIVGLFIRIRDLFRLKNFDIVFIHMYVNPIGTSLFERMYRKFSKKLIFDLEDNRFLGSNKETRGLAQILRNIGKTEFLVKTANHVITSSPALNDICLKINLKKCCTYITSSIDTDKFSPINNYENDHKIVIGWTGTFSTRPYLDLLRSVFIELKKQRDFKLLVIGNFEYEFKEMDLELIQWSAEKEVEELQKIDIGVYPLPMDSPEWVSGKSGLKAIQYMSFGLPAVCLNISTVQNFIENEVNGFLVNNNEEWVTTLMKLIENNNLRAEVGKNARQTVLDNFSKKIVQDQYLNVFNNI